MPRLNGMGPSGLGPKTGRGLGKCVSDNTENNIEPNSNNNNQRRPFLGLRMGLGKKNRCCRKGR